MGSVSVKEFALTAGAHHRRMESAVFTARRVARRSLTLQKRSFKVDVHRSDLEKVLDTLVVAAEHHVFRDQMNGRLHLAKDVRYSPLTSELLAARDRVDALLKHDPAKE